MWTSNARARRFEPDWQRFITAHHQAHPGITERPFSLADASPYAWLAEPLHDARGTVLDLACGSAATREELPNVDWVGIDLSAAELAEAARRGRGPLVRAGADALPAASASVAAVCAAMCLPVVTPCRGFSGRSGACCDPEARSRRWCPHSPGSSRPACSAATAVAGAGPEPGTVPAPSGRIRRDVTAEGARSVPGPCRGASLSMTSTSGVRGGHPHRGVPWRAEDAPGTRRRPEFRFPVAPSPA
ncbi:methyltransferase domain-containing protein [Streptomyces peucetius]|uniref:methyltransferase domain-containing protein n=1 Tax=Streptomyces peucetius TaxID=1950 RepID=UPI0039AEC2DB